MYPPNPSNPESKELIRIVARFRSGEMLKGVSQDFTNMRPSFHMVADDGTGVKTVRMKDLKAVFFVKTLAGNAKREDIRGFLASAMETAQGKKIAVLFQDGELVCGYTHSWTPDREGFFMVPSDQGSNNIRIYVLSAATKQVKAGPAAEALARQILEQQGRSAA
jgi:hypothetical protein